MGSISAVVPTVLTVPLTAHQFFLILCMQLELPKLSKDIEDILVKVWFVQFCVKKAENGKSVEVFDGVLKIWMFT